MSVAEELGPIWDSVRPGIEPLSYDLRGYETLRPVWVRFHSLPGSKRYSESSEEAAEILRRHHAVLTDLGLTGSCFVSTTWYQPEDVSGRGQRRAPELHPGSAWWHTIPPDPEDETPGCFVHASVERYPSPELDELLRKRADDELSGMMILPRHGRWIYSPYDGGADVFAESPEQRDELADRYQAWLSPYRGGL